MNHVVVGLALLLNLTLATSAWAGRSYLPTGLYVAVNLGVRPSTTLLQADTYTGLQIIQNWSAIAPSRDTYDWSYFDDRVAEAAAYGKSVQLLIRRGVVGDGVPAWYTGTLFPCSDGHQLPIPWDAEYIETWLELLRLMTERYHDHPTVTMFGLTGIYNHLSDDWDMCTDTAGDRANWVYAGYTRERMQALTLRAADALWGGAHKSFRVPSINLLDETTQLNSLEAMRDFIITPLYQRYGPGSLPRSLVSQGPAAGSLPTRFRSMRAGVGIGRTIFDHYTADPLGVWNTAAMTGQFQLVYDQRLNIWGQRRLESQGGPCNDGTNPTCVAELTTMLDIALHYGVQFFEIGIVAPTVAQFAAILQCADQAMHSGGGHCGH